MGLCVLRPWAGWRAVVFHSVMSLAGVWQLLAAALRFLVIWGKTARFRPEIYGFPKQRKWVLKLRNECGIRP